MDNWILVLANLKQVEVVCKGQLERIKWYKKGKGADKETPKAFNICVTYQGTSFKQQQKKPSNLAL